jgi:hypothetical protein
MYLTTQARTGPRPEGAPMKLHFFRYVDSGEPISRKDIEAMVLQGLTEIIGPVVLANMNVTEFTAEVDAAIAVRIEHGLIEIIG